MSGESGSIGNARGRAEREPRADRQTWHICERSPSHLATSQSSCGRARMQGCSSEVCAMCSGCDEDRRDMLTACWLIRIERICSPGNAARDSGPPGRGNKPSDAQDG
eukprot:1125400-Prymnesium_polylepis.1